MLAAQKKGAISALQKQYKDAKALYHRHKFDEANKILNEVYPLAVTFNDKKLVGEILSLMGVTNLSLGKYDLSLQQLLEAEKIFKELKTIDYLAEAESNLAAIYRRLELYGHSLLKHLETLTYAFQTNDEYVITTSLVNCAAVFFETGFAEKAFRALDTALLFCDKNKGDIKYEYIRMMTLNNKATFCANLKRLEEMPELLRQAKVIARKYSFSNMYHTIDSNTVTCLTGMKRYEEAYRLLQTIMRKRKNIFDEQQVADLMKMGIIYKDHFHNEEIFLDYADKALKMAEKKNYVSRQILINTLLKDYHQANKNTALVLNAEKRLKILEEQHRPNKQTGGMEKLFDSNIVAVENRLLQRKQKPEFFARYDYLVGAYSYTYRGVTRHAPLRDIAFCEVRGNYLYIHTFTKNDSGKLQLEEGHRLRKTMKDFEQEVSTSKMFFARIHNSFIINLYWLPKNSTGSGNSLTIGDTELPMSDTYRTAFKKKLNAFL